MSKDNPQSKENPYVCDKQEEYDKHNSKQDSRIDPTCIDCGNVQIGHQKKTENGNHHHVGSEFRLIGMCVDQRSKAGQEHGQRNPIRQ